MRPNLRELERIDFRKHYLFSSMEIAFLQLISGKNSAHYLALNFF